jgi:hypothetical protein
MERTGRVGDFQWRFFNGSLFSIIGRTIGNRPEGSVYSTKGIINEWAGLFVHGTGHVPVTLFEAACGEVSIFSQALFGASRSSYEGHSFCWTPGLSSGGIELRIQGARSLGRCSGTRGKASPGAHRAQLGSSATTPTPQQNPEVINDMI